MKKNKQFILNVISQVFILAVNLCITFFLTPIIVKKLGSEAYGFVSLSNDFVNYAMILTVALSSMSGRYITVCIHQKNDNEANKYFTTILISNVILSIIILLISSLIIFFLQLLIEIPNILIIDVKILFLFMILNLLINLFDSVFSVATFATNKLYLQSKRKIESYIIKSIILIICYMAFRPYILYIGIATVASSIYNLIKDIKYTKELLPQLKINKKFFDIIKLKNVILSGIWSSLVKLSGVLSNGLDLIITNKFIGVAAMGSLSISKTVPTMILSAFSLIASVFSPNLTEYYAKEDYEKMQRESLKSVKFLGIFSSIFITILLVYGLDFFKLWVPNENCNLIYNLTILSSFALIFGLPMEGLWNIFIATNKVKKSSLFLMSNAFFTVIIVFILLNYFDFDINTKLYIVASVSTCFSLIRNLLFLPIYSAVCLKCKKSFFYKTISKIFIINIICIITAIILKQIIIINNWILLIMCGAITSILCFALNYIILLESSDKLYIKTIIRKLKRCKL